jgi:hypothetical protein
MGRSQPGIGLPVVSIFVKWECCFLPSMVCPLEGDNCIGDGHFKVFIVTVERFSYFNSLERK